MRRQPEDDSAAAPRPRVEVRLPGFVSDDSIGAGSLLKRVSASMGIAPCGGCARRAAALDRWVAVSGRNSKNARSKRTIDRRES